MPSREFAYTRAAQGNKHSSVGFQSKLPELPDENRKLSEETSSRYCSFKRYSTFTVGLLPFMLYVLLSLHLYIYLYIYTTLTSLSLSLCHPLYFSLYIYISIVYIFEIFNRCDTMPFSHLVSRHRSIYLLISYV